MKPVYKNILPYLLMCIVVSVACIMWKYSTVREIDETITRIEQVLPELSGGRKIVLIDVRTSSEFRSGHCREAYNIPYDVIDQQLPLMIQDRNTPIALYCHSGRRAEIARRALLDRGFKNIINLNKYLQEKEINAPAHDGRNPRKGEG